MLYCSIHNKLLRQPPPAMDSLTRSAVHHLKDIMLEGRVTSVWRRRNTPSCSNILPSTLTRSFHPAVSSLPNQRPPHTRVSVHE